MEPKHEEEQQQQWIVMEEEQEVEEAALEARQPRKHLQDNVISSVLVSSSSPTFNGGAHLSTNGVSSVPTDQPDQPIIQKEEQVAEMGSVCENGTKAAVGLGLVAEFEGPTTNGEAISTNNAAIGDAFQTVNSVYFDKQEGKWKCHHCTWTKQFDSPWTMPMWDLKQNSDLLMNITTLIQHGPCFISENEGSEANNKPYEVQNGDGARSVLLTDNGTGGFNIQIENPDIQKRLSNEVNSQHMKTLEDRGPLSSESSLLHDSSEIKATEYKHFNNETSTKAGSELAEDIDQQLKELDVETVLAKQETHDLICPVCSSCITKRVILRKRKRSTTKLDTKPNPDELDTILSSDPVDNSLNEANRDGNAISTSNTGNLELPPAEGNPVQEREAFRCLECFSIFIPRVNGFLKFWNFGGAREHETSQVTSTVPASNIQNPSIVSNVQNSSKIPASSVQNPSSVPASNGNWFTSLSTPDKGESVVEQGKASPKHSKVTSTVPAYNIQNPSIVSNVQNSSKIPASSVQNPSSVPASNGNWFISLFTPNKGKSVGEQGKASPKHSKAGPAEQNHSSSTSITPDVLPSTENGHADRPVTNTTNDENGKTVPNIKPGHGGLNGIESSDVLEENNDSTDIKMTGIVAKLPSQNFSGVETAITSEEPVDAGELAKDAILKPYERDPDFPVASNVGSEVLQKPQKILEPAVGSDTKGRHVILFVDEVGSTISQTANTALDQRDILTDSATQACNPEQAGVETGEHHGWEILKSIVYGGLIESITSLGIVSSAVSSGAAPLNIIALGLANLIGGLFLIGENLIDLKNDKSGGDQQQTNAQDRYQELLGRRTNFILHAVVAVLSFLIFGSIPIVIYGILINKNYQPEVKLAVVAASSLICIILLAIGKVYTIRPPKSYIKTVMYYVTMALAASGVSYIAGGLVKDLLDKYNHSDSGFVITMPFSGTGTTDPAWASY